MYVWFTIHQLFLPLCCLGTFIIKFIDVVRSLWADYKSRWARFVQLGCFSRRLFLKFTLIMPLFFLLFCHYYTSYKLYLREFCLAAGVAAAIYSTPFIIILPTVRHLSITTFRVNILQLSACLYYYMYAKLLMN